MVSMQKLQTKLFFSFAALIIFASDVTSESDDDEEEYKVIETKNGKVQGILETTLFKEVGFFAFRGIPFAKAPIGKLRFKVSLNI